MLVKEEKRGLILHKNVSKLIISYKIQLNVHRIILGLYLLNFTSSENNSQNFIPLVAINFFAGYFYVKMQNVRISQFLRYFY